MSDPWHTELEQAGYLLIETHVSRVFLRGGDVYKTKRAVSLGFLDFSTLEARLDACRAEVELNRRLAADVYLGVVALVRTEDGALTFAAAAARGARKVLEWAVHMRRLSEDDRADVLLSRGQLGAEDVRRIARILARFHGEARSDAATARFGSAEVVAQNAEENFTQMRGAIHRYVDAGDVAALHASQRAFLAAAPACLAQRAAAGLCRDGHGDLRLEHLYRTPAGGWVAIDCIEFNDRFRFADVCADLAFLTMDLTLHARPDLAELLAAAYAEETGDFGLYAVLDFYQSYRALVRAKVAMILAEDPLVAESARARGAREVRRYFLVALAAARPPVAAARLIVTFGAIASGKSTLAAALGARLQAPVVSSDRVRKQLLRIAPTSPRHEAAFTGSYDAATTTRVYDEILDKAEQVLRAGRSVIVDASFRGRAERARASELAARLGVDAVFLECWCTRPVAMERLARRAAAPSVSDGRAEIYDAFVAQFDPPHELPARQHLRLDTARPIDETLEAALAQLT